MPPRTLEKRLVEALDYMQQTVTDYLREIQSSQINNSKPDYICRYKKIYLDESKKTIQIKIESAMIKNNQTYNSGSITISCEEEDNQLLYLCKDQEITFKVKENAEFFNEILRNVDSIENLSEELKLELI